MEKFSAYRDPGTGIQPFLTPVPPVGSDLLAGVVLPFRYLIGIARTAVVLVLLFLYVIFVPGLCTVFLPIPPLYRSISGIITAFTARAVLLILGFFWIPEQQVRRKRQRGTQAELWNPGAGDVIVSNWVSWIELLWLAYKFNPIFVLPVTDSVSISTSSSQDSKPISHTPGRRTGTGSANIQSPRKSAAPSVPILGFRRVSLLTIIQLTGQVPSQTITTSGSSPATLEELRKNTDAPIVVFPECTTSNGRGLLRFAKIFTQEVPVKKHRVFVMCVRYDPPTALSPTLTLSVPSASFNPLPHIFTVASSLLPPSITLRLLALSESPSSPLFIVSEIAPDLTHNEDQLSEICAALIAQVGKIKRTGMGWEDKVSFLDFYKAKRR